MSTATEAPPSALDAMLAEIDTGAAPASTKYNDKNPPRIVVPELVAKCRQYADVKRSQDDIERDIAALKLDIIAAAEPKRLELSHRFGQHVKSIVFNDLSFQCRPPHYTTRLKGAPRIKEVAALLGARFPHAFKLSYVIPETPAVAAALKAAGVAYEVQCSPTGWLHEARSTDPAIAALLADSIPEVKPVFALAL